MKLIKVNEKNRKKFEEGAQKDKPMLILFYAKWCPHCTMFEPTWKKIADSLATKRNIQVAEIEYSNMEYVPKKYKKIRGYPTIQMIKGGKVLSEYNGLRTQEEVTKFADKYTS